MKVVEIYSHLNGLEYLQVHLPELWEEIKSVIESVDLRRYSLPFYNCR